TIAGAATGMTAPLGDSLRLTAMQRAAAPVPAQHQPVETEAPLAGKGNSRLIWIAAGSVCAVGAIVAVIQFGPKGNTSAKEVAPSTVNEPALTPANPKPAGTPASQAPAGSDTRKQPPTQHAKTPAEMTPAEQTFGRQTASPAPKQSPAAKQA